MKINNKRLILLFLFIFTFYVVPLMAQVSGIHTDKEGKQYAFNKDECDDADFTDLNDEIESRGFIAGAGGGYSSNGQKYYCNPCVKYVGNASVTINNVMDFYRPIESIIHKYAVGASYHYCEIK